MANTVECPVCHGSGMVGASSCSRCRGTGTIKANLEEDRAEDAGEELVTRLEPRRLKIKGAGAKLSSSGRKGLSFKR